MPVVLRPHTYKGRVLEEGQSYGDPYVGVMLITWHGPDVVEIDLTHGRLTRADMLDLSRKLADLGVSTVQAWRADSHALPGGKPIRTEGRFTLWESSIARAIPLLAKAAVRENREADS